MRQLLLGCGNNKDKRVSFVGEPKEWEGELITIDFMAVHKPDVLWDLNNRPLPFKDNEFDRIHGYEILEHIGHQGDWRGFFEEFTEYWRILKPNGLLMGTVPMWNSMGAWGDPSHTRVFSPMTFAFLSQRVYNEDVGRTCMSDFRSVWKGDFERLHIAPDPSGESLTFVLKSIKKEGDEVHKPVEP